MGTGTAGIQESKKVIIFMSIILELGTEWAC